jgi:hypothetical protein
VKLQDGVTEIPLRDGWNIISNPLGKNVSWSAVEEANVDTESGENLQPLWAFDGTFTNVVREGGTFASAASGEAYYFLNDQNLETLKIPYPPGSKTALAQKSKSASSSSSAALQMLSLTAQAKEKPASTVRVGLREEQVEEAAVVAPPTRFEAVSLRIESKNKRSERISKLTAAPRTLKGDGETFRLQLTSRAESPVTLSAGNLQAVEGQSVALLHPFEERAYDLRQNPSIQIRPEEESTKLKLAIGTEGYVEKKKSEVLPEKVRLTSYPNPVGGQGTLEYALPEQQEVSLRLYDIMGRVVATLEGGQKEAGRHTTQLDASQLASGVYFARLRAEGRTVTQKITVVR